MEQRPCRPPCRSAYKAGGPADEAMPAPSSLSWRFAGRANPGGEAGVTVVEANDAEAARGESLAERVRGAHAGAAWDRRSADPEGRGELTAANIPGARLRMIPGMGHFLPEALVPPKSQVAGAAGCGLPLSIVVNRLAGRTEVP